MKRIHPPMIVIAAMVFGSGCMAHPDDIASYDGEGDYPAYDDDFSAHQSEVTEAEEPLFCGCPDAPATPVDVVRTWGTVGVEHREVREFRYYPKGDSCRAPGGDCRGTCKWQLQSRTVTTRDDRDTTVTSRWDSHRDVRQGEDRFRRDERRDCE